ncbi:cell surface glycoprotein MUC18 precursor [Bos taurus]|uniref:MCAM protein n=1 Tax=Bos taurus TaxID=9913 RepID=A8QQF2_BOVIN|nr:cell surface glycoprotein MUC18 precursor [Bos taurus]AAI18106.1 MCAM protein [Bos taurus]DAA22197.1 TPA: melanoma cell adhesion molecule [Bos taurus]
MGRSGLICAFLLAVCCCSRRAAGVPGEAEQPEPELVEVEVGHTALLKCGLSHAQGNLSHVDWFSVHKEKRMLIFRVRQGQGQSEPGEYHNRLSLQDKGTTLVLTGVTPHDDRIFTCQGKRRAQEHRIRLRVYKAPEEPSIQVNTLGISVNSEEPVEVATCVGRNGYPVPQVTWYKNGQSLKEEKNRVHIQSSQTEESNGLFTLRSVLQAQVSKEDKDAQFYCELSYRLPSGNHMKESKEVTVPVFCEYRLFTVGLSPASFCPPGAEAALGLRTVPFACADPAERVWLEVEPEGMLKEGDRVEIRCLADGNPQPPFSIIKQVRNPLFWVEAGMQEWLEVRSDHAFILSQNLHTREMEEERTDDNGVLVLDPAQKEHSGRYECQGLDLETTTSLQSDQQELVVNCEGLGAQDRGARLGQEGIQSALPCLTPLLHPQMCLMSG